MFTSEGIYVGLSDNGQRVYLNMKMANRHGLITGASGTGKTITMKVLAESFSDAGVPVVVCDVKGDVAGLCAPGAQNEGMEKRIDKFGIRDTFRYKSYPVTFWDTFGEHGHNLRATLSEMGPDLLAKVLNLTEAQTGVLQIIFKVADDNEWFLYDLKDLKALIEYINNHKSEIQAEYGTIASQSIGAINRALIPLENQGGEVFFTEPSLDIYDLIRTNFEGKGMINLIHAVKLVNSPTIYASFLLWLISELYETLPEVGDMDRPKLVFFFDEAHLLFKDAPKILVSKIEQLVKLIRSKGVGVYFISQSPGDIPDAVLAQLSNKIQHGLRAYTPAEQKNIKAAANSLRANPEFDSVQAIQELGTGHALISLLDEDGVPGIVQNCSVICPQSLMGKPEDSFFNSAMNSDNMGKYDRNIDSISAYEKLSDIKKEEEELKQKALQEKEEKLKAAEEAKAQKEKEKAAAAKRKDSSRVVNQIKSTAVRTTTNYVVRGVLGTAKSGMKSLFKGLFK